MPGLDAFLADTVTRCEQLLSQLTISTPGIPGDFHPAIDYALQSGGKRVRPALAWAAARAVGLSDAEQERIDPVAVALELVHTYSLLHDDLPAMDDDDLRRGRPTLHKAFDDATAILVGDGLQALAFELLATSPALDDGQKVALTTELARAAGFSGMVGGQYLDIAATGRELSLEELQTLHRLKTGALIRAAVLMGGLAAGASATKLDALKRYGEAVGLAFQVVDDILDVEEESATLGKTGGKDAATNKATYVRLLGLEGARETASHLLESSLEALEPLGQDADLLRELARFIVQRRA
jgi:geranylgeranyl pyrophosphate synthase